MKNYMLLSVAAFFMQLSYAQTDSFQTEGFENFVLDSGQVVNGSNKETFINTSGSLIVFPVSWDTTYKYWSSGWALSKKIDGQAGPSSSTKHLYCAKPGFGAEKSKKGKAFLVGQNNSWFNLPTSTQGTWPLAGFYITNSTYTYNSMRNGDMFAKKFGGKDGKDADSLVLIVRSYRNGQLKDSTKVYLADFRFTDSIRDYLLDTWQYVSLKNTNPDSVTAEMLSSDNGDWGMNTPAFFCADKFTFLVTVALKDIAVNKAKVYPIPAQSVLNIQSDDIIEEYSILDMNGKQVLSRMVRANSATSAIGHLSAGNYVLKIKTRSGIETCKLLIQP
jgi:hypothetical protein